MGDIRRVLWIDDYANNIASSMFIQDETKIVQSMDEALDEIAGEHLYEYDTIVLDIDFENGVIEHRKVIEKLSQKIYLSKDQRNKNFVINNGGYLLFLYLLEKGYPSKQVAFLTGNAGIIGQLKTYNRQNIESLSKEEIVEAFKEAWLTTGDDLEEFEEKIGALPIAKEYKDSDFVFDCAEKLDNKDMKGLENLIFNITPALVTGNIQNTGDMMIFRFHEANLEAPIYFSKNDNDIDGHNRTDADAWLQKGRTKERVTRWLVLSSADYVEKLFRKDFDDMKQQVKDVLKLYNGDGGVRSAYRQMFFVLSGLRSVENSGGISYQAISAMLIPFDARPNFSGDAGAADNVNDDLRARSMSAWCAKGARNFCAHNNFGTELTEKTTLFIMLVSMTALLKEEQRRQMNHWYRKVEDIISKLCRERSGNASVVNKITDLTRDLLTESKIDLVRAQVDNNYAAYSTEDYLYALGYNKTMSSKRQPNATIRENYFRFVLAAYIVKCLDGRSEADVQAAFGEEVVIIYRLAMLIVDEYEYGK